MLHFGTQRSGEIYELGRRGERKILAVDDAITAVSLLQEQAVTASLRHEKSLLTTVAASIEVSQGISSPTLPLPLPHDSPSCVKAG